MPIYAATNLDILSYSARQEIAFVSDTIAELNAADRSTYGGQLFFVVDEGKYYVVLEDSFDLFYLNLQGVTTPISSVAKTVQVSVPAGTRNRWSTLVIDAEITPSAKLWYCLGATTEKVRNGPDEYIDLSLYITPEAGQLRVLLTNSGYFSGPFNINYKVN
jgi:hypothetical protein